MVRHTRARVALVGVPLLVAVGCGAGADDLTATATTDEPAPATVSAAPSPPPQPTPEQTASPQPSATEEASSQPAAPAPTVSPDSVVPSVDVVDVRTGQQVDVASLVPSATPVLLWAWAPHCPACRAEAGSAETFAAAHAEEVTMVGLGTQDDLAYAEGFLRDTGVTTPQMLWDPSFESWAQLGISAQPSWILVDGSGELLDTWVGPLPEDEVLAAARAA